MKFFYQLSLLMTLTISINQPLSAMQNKSLTTITIDQAKHESIHPTEAELAKMSEIVAQQEKEQQDSVASFDDDDINSEQDKTCLSKINRGLNRIADFSHTYKINYIITTFDAAICALLLYDLIAEKDTAPLVVWLTATIATLQGFTYQALDTTIKKILNKMHQEQEKPEEQQSTSWAQSLRLKCRRFPSLIKNNIGAIFSCAVLINAAKDAWRIANNSFDQYTNVDKSLDCIDIAECLGSAGFALASHVKTHIKETIEAQWLEERKKRGSGIRVELDQLGKSRRTTAVNIHDSIDED